LAAPSISHENAAGLRNGAHLRGIVIELLVDDAVVLPSLQRKFVEPPFLAVSRRHLEYPVDGDKIAIDENRADSRCAHLVQPGSTVSSCLTRLPRPTRGSPLFSFMRAVSA
jgi:hypothetical protein